jgi:hypothetical protein
VLGLQRTNVPVKHRILEPRALDLIDEHKLPRVRVLPSRDQFGTDLMVFDSILAGHYSVSGCEVVAKGLAAHLHAFSNAWPGAPLCDGSLQSDVCLQFGIPWATVRARLPKRRPVSDCRVVERVC